MRDWEDISYNNEISFTDEEMEYMLETLYEYFQEGIMEGKVEICLGEVEMEVYIEDYIEDLIELDLISKQLLDDSEILNRWIGYRKGRW